MSYPMLIMQRTSFTRIIVYLDVIVNSAKLKNRNRKVGEFVYKGIRSYTPKSSKVHCYVIVIKKQNKAKFLFKGSGTIHKSLLKLRKRANRYLSLCSPNRLCLNKSQVDAANYCKFIC